LGPENEVPNRNEGSSERFRRMQLVPCSNWEFSSQ
jgi:hypothetical protein